MEADPRHLQHRQLWRSKAVLRSVYADYFERMLAACAPGQVLELGGGSGGLASYSERVIASDLAWAPWLQLVADAQALPFRDASLDNIAMLDVLHHLPDPARLFAEAERTLRPGGRLVMLEPAITPLSWPFYHWLHPEPVDLGADPLAAQQQTGPRDLYDGNQAIPTRLFGRHLRRWQQRFPRLRLVARRHLSLWCYPLSGGYRPWSAVPAALAPALLGLERRLERWLGALAGFRLLLVVERI